MKAGSGDSESDDASSEHESGYVDAGTDRPLEPPRPPPYLGDLAPELRRRQAAIFSIYLHTEGGAYAGGLGPGIRPIALKKAVDIIVGDRGPRAALVQRRLAARVLSSGQDREPLFRKLLRDADRPPTVSLGALAAKTGHDLLKRVRKSIEDQVYKRFQPEPDHKDDLWCVAGAPVVSVEQDKSTLVTTCTIEVDFNLKFERVIAALDPRSWRTCSDYFAASYAVDTDGGQPLSKNGVFLQDTGLKVNLGDTWNGILFERFGFSFDGIDVYGFDNLIEVSQTLSGSSWHLDYSLFRPLEARLGSLGRPGGIDVDSGGIDVRRVNDQARVVATKSIRFTDNTPLDTFPKGSLDVGLVANYIAPYVLRTWTEQSVAEQTCCYNRDLGV